MKIRPLNGYVVAEPYDEKNKSGIILPDAAKENQRDTATVLASNYEDVPVGSRILFVGDYARAIKRDGKIRILIKGTDVIGIVEPELV